MDLAGARRMFRPAWSRILCVLSCECHLFQCPSPSPGLALCHLNQFRVPLDIGHMLGSREPFLCCSLCWCYKPLKSTLNPILWLGKWRPREVSSGVEVEELGFRSRQLTVFPSGSVSVAVCVAWLCSLLQPLCGCPDTSFLPFSHSGFRLHPHHTYGSLNEVLFLLLINSCICVCECSELYFWVLLLPF